MKAFKKSIMLIALLLLVGTILVACGDDTPADPAPNGQTGGDQNGGQTGGDQTGGDTGPDVVTLDPGANPEPVTLKMLYPSHDEIFEERIKGPIEEMYPHITMEHIHLEPTNRQGIEEALAAGEIPDLYYLYSMEQLPTFLDLQLTTPLEPLIERFQFDTSIYQQNLLTSLRSLAPNNEQLLLPYIRSIYTMYYDKDLFDEFSIPYPTDNMTWEETVELARQFPSTNANGEPVFGIAPANSWRMMDALNPTFLDPDTHEPRHSEEPAVRRWLEIMQEIIDINRPALEILAQDEEQVREGNHADFYNRGSFTRFGPLNVGLYPHWTQHNFMQRYPDLNWDWVTYPQFPEAPGVIPESKGAAVGIGVTDHPEDAFRVLAYLTSPEHHGEFMLPGGSGSQFEQTQDIMDNYLSDIPEYRDTNLENAIFSLPSSTGPERRSRYEPLAVQAQFMLEGLIEGKDINTILREVEEVAREVVREARMTE